MNRTLPPQLGSSSRLHSLDCMRASMMLLGIVIHVIDMYCDYTVGRIPDNQTGAFYNVAYVLLHSFRMPAFFIIAGFFAALLYERRGARMFIANRSWRIVVPLIVGWLPLFISGWLTLAYAAKQSGAKFVVSYKGMGLGRFVLDNGLVHLWFLYYLIFYYVLALGAFKIWAKLTAGVVKGAGDLFARYASSPLGLVLLSLITFAPLLTMPLGILETPLSFLPSFFVLFVYGVFFAFGVALYNQSDLLFVFRRNAWTRLVLGLAIFPLNYAVIHFQGSLFSTDLRKRALAAITSSLIAWLFSFGFLGLFLEYTSEHNPYVRYLSDASYWLYLVHPPLVNFIGGVLATKALPLWLKPSMNLLITIPLLLLTYYLFVRSTFIGKTLNGRRYPRSLPKPEREIKTLHATA